MDRENLIEFLLSAELFARPRAEEIAGHFAERIIPKNELFLKEGKISNEYLFLESGLMRAFAYDIDGNDVTTNFCLKGQVVFEIGSFFHRTLSRENIQAVTDCKGWFITYQQLNTLFHELYEFREFGRYILVRGFAALKVRMLSMITETAEERYANLLNTSPEILQYASLKTIASYLGITDTSLSRIRKEYSNSSPR